MLLATGLSGCDPIMEAHDRAINAVASDLRQATNEVIDIDADWDNGRLTQVAVTFRRPYDGKPIGELAAAIRNTVATNFEQTPQKLLLNFKIKAESQAQSGALPPAAQHQGFKEAKAAVESDLQQATGARADVGLDWKNENLVQVTAAFPQLYDSKPIGELAADVGKAVAAEFKQEPQTILLTFDIKSGSDAQSSALPPTARNAAL
jgi:hypothetical protein